MSRLYIIRLLAAIIQIALGFYFFLLRKKFDSLKALCWAYRVPDIIFIKKILHPIFVYIARKCYNCDQNPILNSFLKTKYNRQIRKKYSIDNQVGKLNIFRDILILSKQIGTAKGVIIMKYGESFDAVCSIFDLNKLMQNYVLILETSWSGACDPTFFMFIRKDCPVVVEFPESNDCHFIKTLKTNLIPWQKGAGDWLNKKIVPSTTKIKKLYDLIMVANWAKFKNHKLLFNALNKIQNKNLNVLLIGFPFNGRTKEDVLGEFNKEVKNVNSIKLTILENISADKVLYYLSISKIFILLTRKEGSNRALSESFAVGTPAIVYKFIKGGAAERINPKTGILSDFYELNTKIEYMLENYSAYSPQEYILNYSNSQKSTIELSQLLKDYCEKYNIQCNFKIAEKTNAPNLEYVDNSMRNAFKSESDKVIHLTI